MMSDIMEISDPCVRCSSDIVMDLDTSDHCDSEAEAMPRKPSAASKDTGSGFSNSAFVSGVNVGDLRRVDVASLHFSLDDSVHKSSIPTTVPNSYTETAIGTDNVRAKLSNPGPPKYRPKPYKGKLHQQGAPRSDQLHLPQIAEQMHPVVQKQPKQTQGYGDDNGKTRDPTYMSSFPLDNKKDVGLVGSHGVGVEPGVSAHGERHAIKKSKNAGKESRDKNKGRLDGYTEQDNFFKLHRSSSVSDLRSLRSSERYKNDYLDADLMGPLNHRHGNRSGRYHKASTHRGPPIPIYAVPRKSFKNVEEIRQNRKNTKLLPFLKPGTKRHADSLNYDHISASALFTDGRRSIVKGPGVYGHLPDPEDRNRGHRGLIDLAKERFYPSVSISGRRRCWPPWAICLLFLILLLILAVILACVLLLRPREEGQSPPPPIVLTCPGVTTTTTIPPVTQPTTIPKFTTNIGHVVEFPGNPSIYVVVRAAIPWREAASKCFDIGGYLAHLEMSEEWNQLRRHLLTLDTLRDSERSINFWIGGITLLPGASYFWYATGEPVSSNLWAPGEPNYQNKREYCVAIDVARDGLLNDSVCEGLNLYTEGYVCEVPPNCVFGRRRPA